MMIVELQRLITALTDILPISNQESESEFDRLRRSAARPSKTYYFGEQEDRRTQARSSSAQPLKSALKSRPTTPSRSSNYEQRLNDRFDVSGHFLSFACSLPISVIWPLTVLFFFHPFSWSSLSEPLPTASPSPFLPHSLPISPGSPPPSPPTGTELEYN